MNNNNGFVPDNYEPEKPKDPVEPMNNNNLDSNSSMNNNYSSNINEAKPKDKNKLIMIIGGVVIVVLIIVLVIVLVGKKKSPKSLEDYEKELQKIEEKEKKKEEELSKHYEVKTHNLANGEILIEFENKNSDTVDVTFKVDFYDANNNLINSENAYIFSVKGNYKAYTDVFLLSNERNFSTFKVDAKLSKSTITENFTDKVEIVNVNKTSNNIMVQVKNNANKKLKIIDLAMLYYDAAGNVIGYSGSNINDLDENQTTSVKFTLPYDAKYNHVDFSKHELHVNSAYYSLY